jgi:hypothetical protein
VAVSTGQIDSWGKLPACPDLDLFLIQTGKLATRPTVLNRPLAMSEFEQIATVDEVP